MYIVLETHGGAAYVTICLDHTGTHFVFDNLSSAVHYANTECLDGLTVRID